MEVAPRVVSEVIFLGYLHRNYIQNLQLVYFGSLEMNWQHKEEEELWHPRETKVNRVFDIYGKTFMSPFVG